MKPVVTGATGRFGRASMMRPARRHRGPGLDPETVPQRACDRPHRRVGAHDAVEPGLRLPGQAEDCS